MFRFSPITLCTMKYSLLFSLLFLASFLPAQTSFPSVGRLYGKVVSGHDPVSYASVTVYKILPGGKDTLINGALTKENGEFNITQLPMGNFKVKISYLGSKDLEKTARISPPDHLEQDLGDLALESDTKVLGTVDITAEKASTTMNLEKRVFNVDKNITALGGTAEDVLKNVPSVTVDMDGNAKLRDKSATIYVDGKPSLLTINQIPADQIESVEVITNPSAKYEASTMGGILNLVMKKNTKPGYSGILVLGAGTQDRYNGMLNLNVKQGRWNVSGMYSYNTSDVVSTGYVYRTNFNNDGSVAGYFDQNSTPEFQNTFQTGRLGVDYSINNRNTLSLEGTVTHGIFDIPVSQNYSFSAPDRSIASYGLRQTLSDNAFNRNSVQMQWIKTFAAKGKSLSSFINYSWGDVQKSGNWNTTGYDAAGISLPNYPELANIDGAGKNQQAVFQLDYALPINDSSKIETGVRSYWNHSDDSYFFSPFDYEQNAYVVDHSLSQDNGVTELINAAYVSYAGKLKHDISYQAGLRFEQSSLTGTSRLADHADFGYDYPQGNTTDFLRSLFPSLNISKKIDDNTDIGLNFSRKIQRPRPMMLMPGILASDKQNIQIGNPNLQPEFVNTAEFNINKIFGNNNWLGSAYISNETNTLKPLLTPSQDDPEVLVTQFVNGRNELTYGFENTLKLAFGKQFDVTLSANVFRYNVTVDTFNNTGFAVNGKVNLNYRLPANFTLQVNGAYEGNRPIPQGNRQGIAYMDIAVKKSFFHKAANVVFSVNDVFNTRKEITTFSLPVYEQEVMRRRDTRYFKLSLQIPFGKGDMPLFNKSKKPDMQDIPDFSGN